jgi:DNA-directed RNA polymerase specialized sigma24 family protein
VSIESLIVEYRDLTDEVEDIRARYQKEMNEVAVARHAVILAMVDKGHTHAQVAQMTGITAGRVSHIVVKARREGAAR